MRDPDVRKFLLWTASILLVFWTIGYGLNAAIILVVPEPLPTVSNETLRSIHEAWWTPRDLHLFDMVRDLGHQEARLRDEALHEDDRLAGRPGQGYGWLIDIEGHVSFQEKPAPKFDCGRYELRTANMGESHSTGAGIGP